MTVVCMPLPASGRHDQVQHPSTHGVNGHCQPRLASTGTGPV